MQLRSLYLSDTLHWPFLLLTTELRTGALKDIVAAVWNSTEGLVGGNENANGR
jgi:hypothetical protein